ncbi:Synerg-CTERM sorting domain-containing protein [Cloacibacillus evryensis]|uniref:Synerg-CTERM sorting domain-containing protein n=1 Tax=Cloacibacillus evryensis TaxID=508460 RepID=UPI00241FA29C|nr:Synerg-CTERM sorting domain-containing protein [Cloacibacillus evryensis]
MKLSRKYCILALFLVLSALIGAAWAVDDNITWTDDTAVLTADHTWNTSDDEHASVSKIDLKGYTLTVSKNEILGNSITVTGDGSNAAIQSTSQGSYIYGAHRIENFKLTSESSYLYVVGTPKSATAVVSTDIVIKNVEMTAPSDNTWRLKQFKVVGGGYNITNNLSSTAITIEDSLIGHSVYGGTVINGDKGERKVITGTSVDKTLVNINSGAVVVRSVYGGGEARDEMGNGQKRDIASSVGTSHVIVDGGSVPGTYTIKKLNEVSTEKGYVYGGGNAVNGDEAPSNPADTNPDFWGTAASYVKEALVEIKGGKVAHVRGGGRAEATEYTKSDGSVSSVDKAEIRLIGNAGLQAITEDVKAGGEQAYKGVAYVGSAIIKLSGLTSAAAPKEGLVIDGSGTENGTTLVFENVKADLSSAAITSMDAVQIDSDSKAIVKNIGGAKKIVVTGDFNKKPAADILTLNEVSPDDVTVDISGAVNVAKYEWDGKKLMVMGTSSGTAEPTTPKLPADIPAGVEPAEAEIAVVAADADEAVKAAALEEVSAELKDIASSDLAIGASGAVTAKAETVKSAAASLVAAGETISTVSPLPVFGAEVTAGNTAAVAYKIKGADLLAASAADVKVVKYLGGGKAELFKYAAAAADFADTCFTVMLHDTDTIAGSIEPETEYDLVLFVKDGGSFDLAEETGMVADPAALIKTEKKSSGGSSSGCNGGYGALMILAAALLPLAYRRKK